MRPARCLLLLLMTACAGCSASQKPVRAMEEPGAPTAPVLVERIVEELPPPLPNHPYLTLSADGRKWAYKHHDERGNRVIHNGKEGPAYEDIGLLALSPDGERIAYRVERKGPPFRAFVVCDGKESARYDHVSHIVFSPDSRHVAYPAVLNGQWFMITDGEAGRPYDRVGFPLFSSDGNRLAYSALRGDDAIIVIDGIEHTGDYDKARVLAFSPDGAHVLWSATRGGKEFLVIDGIEGLPYDKLESRKRGSNEPRFIVVDDGNVRLLDVSWPADAALGDGASFEVLSESLGTLPRDAEIRQIGPDGKTCVFVQSHEDGETIFLGDRKLGTWDRTDYNVNFSPAGKHVWFEAQRAGQWYIVRDDKELPIHERGGGRLTLSPDGERYALACQREGKWRIVLDGVEGPAYDRISGQTFSPDGTRFAHGAGRGDETFLVLDGKELKKYSGGEPCCRGVYHVTFSPDSRHVAYGVIHKEHQGALCLDDEEICEGPEVGIPDLVFSPDGKLAFCDGGVLWCDGLTNRDHGVGRSLRFSADGRHLAFIARRDEKEFMVCDGIGGPAHDFVYWPPESRRIEERLRYVVRDGDRSLLVETDWPAGRDWQSLFPPRDGE